MHSRWIRFVVALSAFALLVTGLGAPAKAETAVGSDLRLVYDEPGTDWEKHSLPLGNGSLGATVLGGVPVDRVQLNDQSFWSGGPGCAGYTAGNWSKSSRPSALDSARQKIASQGWMDSSEFASLMGTTSACFGAYQPFGELSLTMPSAPFVDYERSLDLSTGIAEIRYSADGTQFSREYLVSHPDNVLAVHFTKEGPASLNLDVTLLTQTGGLVQSLADGSVVLQGALTTGTDANGMRFRGRAKVVTQGGTVSSQAGRQVVSGADEITVFWSGGTDYANSHPTYRGADPGSRVAADVNAAAAKGWDGVRADHVADHQSLFERVSLELDGTPLTGTTDQELAAYTGARPQDRTLEALYYQYGRYLAIASSREGALPGNLQGLWNNSTSPVWKADYHANINIQMNYWQALAANLPESHLSYTDWVSSLVAPGQVSASTTFGARGWVSQFAINPFGWTGLQSWYEGFWFPESAAWMSQSMWQKYRYDGDLDYLRNTGWPVLSEASKFWLDMLWENDGKLYSSPSYSPEHGPVVAGATASQQLIGELFHSTLLAAEALDIEDDTTDALTQALPKLAPGIIVSPLDGTLQEWQDPAVTMLTRQGHRHFSHLHGLFPGGDIDPRTEPELALAARKSIEARGDADEQTGPYQTGWSRAWRVNLWARLLDGDKAHGDLTRVLRSFTHPNLWNTHYVRRTFQIEGNFGAGSGVNEMLLQSHLDEVDVLPALPTTWAGSGSFDGLVARGGHEVGADWTAGELTQVRLRVGHETDVSLRLPGMGETVQLVGTDVTADVVDGVATFTGLEPGATYVIEELTATPSPTASPTPSATPSVSTSPTPTPQPSVTPTSTPPPSPSPSPAAPYVRSAPYTLPGLHQVNGRQWQTTCEKYSQTERCRTNIWATVVSKDSAGGFVVNQGWAFNNLTYLPFMTREAWGSNPLANHGAWTAESDGRRWRTECDTAATGRGGCRTYTLTTVYSSAPRAGGGYNFAQQNLWVFNNQVIFRR